MTDNEKMREDAIREAARNAALDEYFKARPQLMRTRHEECLFEAGFDRALQAAKSVPDGWKLVPIRATAEMVDSVLRYANGDDLDFYGANELRQEIAKDWELLLAAVPEREGK